MLWPLNRVSDVQDLQSPPALRAGSFPGAAAWGCVGKELGLRVKNPPQIPDSHPGKGISHPTAGCGCYPCTPPLCSVPCGVYPCPGVQMSTSPCNMRIGLGSQRSPPTQIIPKSHCSGCGEVDAGTTTEAQCVH